MACATNPDWPVLSRYDAEHLATIAMPLGGIGTGTVSLGGRGQLRDWEIQNRARKDLTGPAGPGVRNIADGFFSLCVKPPRREPIRRCLEGCLAPPYQGGFGVRQPCHGLPRFRECSFHAAYPLGQVCLADPDVPVTVRLEAFNPLVPPDAGKSGLPLAVLRYVLTNRTGSRLRATVAGSLRNLNTVPTKRNRRRTARGLSALVFEPEDGDQTLEGYGSLALATTAPKRRVSHTRLWPDGHWNTPLLHFWDDLADGRLEDSDRGACAGDAIGSLAASVTVPPRGEASVTFLVAWHFPNRYSWRAEGEPTEHGRRFRAADRIGNEYCQRYADAWDVLKREAGRLRKLETETLGFVQAFCAADLPREVKEAALCNLSTLRTETCFRTPDGRLYGWEGTCDREGCCWGSCTHVWNYEQTTPFLFGELAMGMRDVEFNHATDPQTGHMVFRVDLPLSRARAWPVAAADGQLGTIMKMYRDWQLSGDTARLRRWWPRIRAALSFCWIEGGWDADRDGVMEGCQHNTMDVEYYGPNPQMQIWYLGALRAAEAMAAAAGDPDVAATCRELREAGAAWCDENLFNGEYYEHLVEPVSKDAIADGLMTKMGAQDPLTPDFQIGAGCLIDQLVGQCMAHVCGLGHLVGKGRAKKALRSVYKYNFRKSLHDHFNNMRTFALNDEAATLMATYPRGRRPEKPFPYHSEVMTGFEYTAAAGLLYEGETRKGLEMIRAVRARYDGRRRNPFDEAECGHHYARAMAAWAAVLALSGFHYSGVEKTMTLAADAGVQFWSTGYAWGTCRQHREDTAIKATLRVEQGCLPLQRLVLRGHGEKKLPRPRRLTAGKQATVTVPSG